MEYKCSVCGETIKEGMEVFLTHTDKHVVDIIKEKHPQWVDADGVCHKCVEYYKKQMKGDLEES